MKYKKYIWPFFITIISITLIWSISLGANKRSSSLNEDDYDAIVYKSPNCGCCVKYVAYLKQVGYEVKTVKVEDMSTIKDRYNIPDSMESCHTMIVDNYVVEGHVPLEVIEDMLEKRPDIEGIALPDMPAGSPGMPGIKQEAFKVYSLAKNNPIYINY